MPLDEPVTIAVLLSSSPIRAPLFQTSKNGGSAVHHASGAGVFCCSGSTKKPQRASYGPDRGRRLAGMECPIVEAPGGPLPRGVSEESTPEEVFSGSPRGLELFHAVEAMLAAPTPAGDPGHEEPGGLPGEARFRVPLVAGPVPRFRGPRRAVDRAPAAHRFRTGSRRWSTRPPGCGCITWSCIPWTSSTSRSRLAAGGAGGGGLRPGTAAGATQRGGRTEVVRPPRRTLPGYGWSILIFLAVVSGAVTGAGARTSRTPSL